MLSQEKTFEYKGLKVKIDTWPVGKRIAWEFQVERGRITMGPTTAPNEALAVLEAASAARRHIDNM